MPDGGNKTYRELRDWMGSPKESERLCAHLMSMQGYTSLDPSQPLGGPDGAKDALMVRDGQKWIMAVSFNRAPVTISSLKSKFVDDCAGVEKNNAIGIAFCTNQKLTKSEQREIRYTAPSSIEVDLFHLERIRLLLDQPRCYGIRLQFLDIEMSKEDQIAFIASLEDERNKYLSQALREQNAYLKGLITGGSSCFECLISSTIGADQNQMQLFTWNRGENILYDVQVVVEHTTAFDDLFATLDWPNNLTDEKVAKSVEFKQRTRQHYELGNLRPGQGPTIFVNLPSDKYSYVLEVAAYARNGKFFTKFSLCRKDNGSWAVESREYGKHLDIENKIPKQRIPGEPVKFSDLFVDRYPKKKSN